MRWVDPFLFSGYRKDLRHAAQSGDTLPLAQAQGATVTQAKEGHVWALVVKSHFLSPPFPRRSSHSPTKSGAHLGYALFTPHPVIRGRKF